MTKESQSPKFLPCKIVRESKIIKFNDTNEIEEETTFLVEFDNKSIEDNKEYVMELPITYFRIPEKSIKEYEDFQEVKSSIELFKKLKKQQEDLDILDMIIKKYEKYIQELEDTAEDNQFKIYLEFKDKEKKRIKELVQEIKDIPKVRSFIDKEKFEMKNLSLLLNETNSDDLIEKIIWCFIFEEVFNLQNSCLISLKKYIEDEIKSDKKDTRLKKIKFDEKIKSEIKLINIREYLEASGKFETSINYPNTKRKKLLNHNSDFKFFYFFFLQFITFFFLIAFEEFTSIFLYLILLIIVLMGISIGITKLILIKNRLMKGDDLLEKFDQAIEIYLNENDEHPNTSNENQKIRLYLDSLSEKLFNRIYKAIYNDLDKCIFDYKSFNPMSLEILFENNEYLLPIKTPTAGFFHKTIIPIYLSDLQKNNFSVKIETRNIIRKNKKNKKIMNLKIIRPKNIKSTLIIQIVLTLGLISYLIFYELEIIPTPSYILFLFTGLYIIFSFISILFYTKFRYVYNSKLTQFKNIEGKFELNRYRLVRNRKKVIYSLPIILREDCSYYYTIYAPNYHNLKFTEEIRVILNEINIRLPMELSTNIISFNIPRRLSLENKVEFDIDLEIPLTNTVKWWIFGIFSMIFLLLSIGILFLGSIINPLFLEGGIDISSLRFVLTFLTLLIGFFGKDIISNPTKDLYKVSIYIIFFSIVVGILFVIPIFI